MSLSKWLSRDNGPHNRTHLSPLLQHEGEEDDREDSTMTITSTNGLRRASLVRLSSWPGVKDAYCPTWFHQQSLVQFYSMFLSQALHEALKRA